MPYDSIKSHLKIGLYPLPSLARSVINLMVSFSYLVFYISNWKCIIFCHIHNESLQKKRKFYEKQFCWIFSFTKKHLFKTSFFYRDFISHALLQIVRLFWFQFFLRKYGMSDKASLEIQWIILNFQKSCSVLELQKG